MEVGWVGWVEDLEVGLVEDWEVETGVAEEGWVGAVAEQIPGAAAGEAVAEGLREVKGLEVEAAAVKGLEVEEVRGWGRVEGTVATVGERGAAQEALVVGQVVMAVRQMVVLEMAEVEGLEW
uniref:Uncharacterized protein n=1 Tax=Chlamydomonas euryale TaxID=1486919 RepID=A0A7R9VQ80_9CHLO